MNTNAIAMAWTARGSNPRRGEIFRTRTDLPWGPPSLLCNGYRVLPGGVKRRLPSTPSSAEVKERVELYLYSPSWPSWPVLGCSLPLPLPLQKCDVRVCGVFRNSYSEAVVG